MKPGAHGLPHSAFSLVEVAIALGILSFSLLAIVGLIPVALQTSRDSIERSTKLHITQSMRANLLNIPYSLLPAEGDVYFDAHGDELPGDGTETFYQVHYKNLSSTSLPAEQTAPNLTTSQIEIRNVVTGQIHASSFHLPDNGF